MRIVWLTVRKITNFYLGVKGLTTVSLKETHMKLFSIYLIKETFFFLPPEIPPNPPKNMLNNSSGVISAITKKYI